MGLKMRCIRKVENEDFYIIYCNTMDMLWAGMYGSVAVATKLIELQINDKILFNKVYLKIKKFQGIISKFDINEMINH